jgi:hypothetical protein
MMNKRKLPIVVFHLGAWVEGGRAARDERLSGVTRWPCIATRPSRRNDVHAQKSASSPRFLRAGCARISPTFPWTASLRAR